jgi:hypothetical protein
LGRSLDRRKTNKVNFEIPKLTTSPFWKLAPSLENSAKKQHGSKESGSKSEITDRNVYAQRQKRNLVGIRILRSVKYVVKKQKTLSTSY